MKGRGKRTHYFDCFSLKGQSIKGKYVLDRLDKNVNIITSLSLENILEII